MGNVQDEVLEAICRPPAPFVYTYLGRSDKKSGRPFRFILNNSKATAAPFGPNERQKFTDWVDQ